MRFLLSLALAGSFAVTMCAQQPSAPVAFTSFNAVPRGEHVLLSWNPEKPGVTSYQLEKSQNGNDYVAFAQVQGAADITEFLETDFAPFEGLSYYRLRVTTVDGGISYSNVAPVKYNEKGEPVSPVAVTDEKYRSRHSDQPVLVVVRNAAGEEFYSMVEVKGKGNPVECNDPDPVLNTGTYTIVGCSEQEYYCREMVVK